MKYVTINDLSCLIRDNIHSIPHDVDLVLGVPRSGMLPANIIALFLNVRLGDIDSFISNGSVMQCGSRKQYIANAETIKKILVIDDSVATGSSMNEAKQKLKEHDNKYDIIYCSPIVTTLGKQLVDIYFTIIDGPRIFEWNLFHHAYISKTCLDIDGVLCCDPIVDDDGMEYINFIQTATPKYIPTVKVGALISCRLEKYRQYTEEWLNNNNVQYEELILLNKKNKLERIKWGKHGEFKAEFFKNSGYILFIESSYQQAVKIAEISHKPVICIETNTLIECVDKANNLKSKVKNVLFEISPMLEKKVIDIYRKIKYR